MNKRITVVCGGVGAARLLRALTNVVDPTTVSAVINVADDMVHHGLSISPDIDTVTYTLADAIDPERGWGLRHESWRAMEAIRRYGDGDWFSLGDQDLATHMYRSSRLADGATLTEVTAEVAKAWDIGVELLPVSNDPIRTRVTREDTGEEIAFQEYFVRHRHLLAVSKVRFAGIDTASVTSQARRAIEDADIVLIAPSNPIVSIAPVLGVPGVRHAITNTSAPVVAISPIIGGAALKGPAAAMLAELGHESSAVGVAELWADVVDVLLIDDADAALARSVAGCGVVPLVTDTIMATPERGARLAKAALSAAGLHYRS